MNTVSRLAWFGSLTVFGAVACNAILGVDDPILDVTSDGGADGGSGDGGADDALLNVDCGAPPAPDDGPIYVATTGADGEACGSHGSPCKTIGFGIGQAQRLSKTVVRVARGTYAEVVTLVPNVTVEGGYLTQQDGNDYAWTPDCRDRTSASDDVHIAPNVSMPVIAADVTGGTATLSTVTVNQNTAPAPGESVYGIVATGAATHLTLKEVIVMPANGGDGATGATGDAGSAPLGECVAGSGAGGAKTGAVGSGGDATDGGAAVDGKGYHPAFGAAGGAGDNGSNGDAGAAGGCVTCSTCNTLCQAGPTVCGDRGHPGCAGSGGTGGTGGGGGGSSIALFAWGATVTVTGGKLTAGSGGRGGTGGAGGPGGPGAKGAQGAVKTDCSVTCLAGICSMMQHGAGGEGSVGGSGAAGGQGGGGAGGWSYGVLTGGGAIVDAPDGVTDHANSGNGGDPGGASGLSGKRYP